ncbi:hypothetical protein TNCT_196361 [Trichonephila clavata]|uniref:Uncharacterized protein n=1 Tax=Trichonephila clavata TaxID=2740835 RepID=A0A8X6JFV0_TRICU|nr:hypothetical protein TNCT_196361 [Trichonephila clavata]
MPQSLHNVQIPEGLVVNDCTIPIGQISEEATEVWKKVSKYFGEHYYRKCNWQQSMEDMMLVLLVSSDPT